MVELGERMGAQWGKGMVWLGLVNVDETGAQAMEWKLSQVKEWFDLLW